MMLLSRELMVLKHIHRTCFRLVLFGLAAGLIAGLAGALILSGVVSSPLPRALPVALAYIVSIPLVAGLSGWIASNLLLQFRSNSLLGTLSNTRNPLDYRDVIEISFTAMDYLPAGSRQRGYQAFLNAVERMDRSDRCHVLTALREPEWAAIAAFFSSDIRKSLRLLKWVEECQTRAIVPFLARLISAKQACMSEDVKDTIRTTLIILSTSIGT